MVDCTLQEEEEEDDESFCSKLGPVVEHANDNLVTWTTQILMICRFLLFSKQGQPVM